MILKDILTGEQIDMLKSDLSDHDLFTLLFWMMKKSIIFSEILEVPG